MSAERRSTSGAVHVNLGAAVLAPVIMAVGTAVIALQVGSSWLLFLAAAPVGLLVAALVVRPQVCGLDIGWAGPARCRAGDTVTHRFVARNLGPRPSSSVRLTHVAPGFDDATVAVPALAAGGSATVEVSRTAQSRAHAPGSLVLLRTPGVFGFLEVTRAVELRHLLVVHPAPAPVRLPLSGGGDGADTAPVAARHGIDVHGVRDWRAGDAARDVSWRATARRGRLVVVERELPAEPRFAVLVTGSPAAPDWEQLVSVIASSAVAALRAGRPVALAAGQAGLAPVLDGGETAVLDWCAALADAGPATFANLRELLTWAGRGGQLFVAVPGGPDPAWWSGVRALADGAGVRLGALVLDETAPA